MNSSSVLRACARCIAFGLALVTGPAFAQTGSTGTIEGRVLNATSGRYVDNARVTVDGTNLEAITDLSGQYRLTGVPAGAAHVKVHYIGLAPGEATVTVRAGQSANQDFTLGRDNAPGDDLTKLDPFVVAAARDLNNTAIAINEQRSAPNVKTVISTELVGDLATDNVAEIMKYLPGVTLDSVSEASGINIRGFAANFTTITMNGALISTASPDPGRTVSADRSANGISRIEVTKVPTPEMAASALGGSVNFVGKSAFESAKPVFRYRLNLSVTSDEPNIFKKTPGPRDEYTYKGLPSFDFTYIVPVSRNFGFTINGVTSNQYSGLKHELSSTWRFVDSAPAAAAPNVATPANPYFQSMSYGPQARTIWRDGFGVTADWRPAKDHVISAQVQLEIGSNLQDALLQVPTVGSSDSSATAGGQFLTFGPTFTYGATGRGADNQQKFTYDQSNSLELLNITHRYNGRAWQVDSGLSTTLSKSWWRDLSRGHFFNVRTTLTGISRVLFDEVGKPSLANKITTLDAAGKEIDWTRLASYRMGSVETAPRDGRNTLSQARLNLRRSLDFLPFEANLKVGGSYSVDKRDMLRTLNSYTFVGKDGVANTADDTAAPFLDAKSNVPKWRFVPYQEFVSSYQVAQLFKDHPEYFAQSESVKVTNEVNRITKSYDLKEEISAAYVQAEGRMWQNRLRVLTGVRFEKTADSGNGPLFDPNGVFQRNAAGTLLRVNNAFVRKPEAGPAGSLQELPFLRKERGAHASKSYDGYYPSLHLTFNATENFIVRAAYAETFGRPNLPSILPNTTVGAEAITVSPGAPPGNITVSNTNLKPYSAKSFDLSAEHYFARGGLFSVGVFRKDLKDFFGTLNTVATPALLDRFGLDPGYVGWNLQSTVNVGSAKVTGYEANFNSPPLTFIPFGGRFLSVFANYTRIHLEGTNQTDFSGFVPESGTIGVTYSRKPLLAVVRWNYRGIERRGLTGSTLPGGFDYLLPFPSLDISVEYQMTRHITVFASSRNALNAPRLYQRWNDVSPYYSRYYRDSPIGVQTAFGIKGSF